MAGASLGALENCGFYPVENFEIKALNSPNTTKAYPGDYKFTVTQESDNSFRYQFYIPGKYTICIWQDFRSVVNPEVSSEGNFTSWTVASVIVNVVSPIKNIEYSWDDPIFYEYGRTAYNFQFKCGSGFKNSDSTYKCSIQAKSKITNYDLDFLGLSPSTSVKIVGSIPVDICVVNNDFDFLWPCEGPPADLRTVSRFRINVGFDTPTTFKVKNYLNITGYTGVQIAGNFESGDPRSSYSWERYDYQAKKRKAANAPPPSAVLKATTRQIRSGMQKKCQNLPSGFSKFSVKYKKRIASGDGVPGYVFEVNKQLSLQVFGLGEMRIGPSPTSKDSRFFIAWGCGTSAFWDY